ncbi:hypothetical protein GQ600_9731 [Phytophthora cactorum]|nr:hypothetical protein GQ600_9731 [Phytophthora cactorum]
MISRNLSTGMPVMFTRKASISIAHLKGRLHQPPKFVLVRLYGCSKVLVPGFAPGVIGIPVLSAQVNTTTLAKFTLTEPLTTDYIAKLDPDPAAATEMQRLIALICEPPYTPLEQHIHFHQWRSHQNVRQH